jgi:hypothetical protein
MFSKRALLPKISLAAVRTEENVGKQDAHYYLNHITDFQDRA